MDCVARICGSSNKAPNVANALRIYRSGLKSTADKMTNDGCAVSYFCAHHVTEGTVMCSSLVADAVAQAFYVIDSR